MNKYVNIEVAKEYLRHDSFSNPYFRSQACQQAMDVLDTVPVADVVEVRHGRWHDVYMSSASSFVGTCSVCGKSNDIPPVPLANYCPSCGAKMDGGHDDA